MVPARTCHPTVSGVVGVMGEGASLEASASRVSDPSILERPRKERYSPVLEGILENDVSDGRSLDDILSPSGEGEIQ